MEMAPRTLRQLPFYNGFSLANTYLLKRQNINFLLNVHVKNVTFAVLQIVIYAKPTGLVFSYLKNGLFKNIASIEAIKEKKNKDISVIWASFLHFHQ